MKLAIFGDSFGIEDSDNDNIGWASLLGQNHNVTNFCQAGIGEYKIYRSIKNCNLLDYDCVLITHTSPFRVHSLTNPLHLHSKHHKNCDIILADIENRADAFSTMAKNYFKFSFDSEYYIDIHNLLCQQIHSITKSMPAIHLTHFDYNGLYNFDKSLINFYNHWINNKGSVNHYSTYGNQIVFDQVTKVLNEL